MYGDAFARVFPWLLSSIQAILSAVWDREGTDLMAWGCLLDAGSFHEVMFSELYRSAWVSTPYLPRSNGSPLCCFFQSG